VDAHFAFVPVIVTSAPIPPDDTVANICFKNAQASISASTTVFTRGKLAVVCINANVISVTSPTQVAVALPRSRGVDAGSMGVTTDDLRGLNTFVHIDTTDIAFPSINAGAVEFASP
jgi:hypothetical protein